MKSIAAVAGIAGGLELKYCERCGGLWLRPAGGPQIYCSVCARAMADLPPSSRDVDVAAPMLRKKPKRNDKQVNGRVEKTAVNYGGGMA